MTILSDLRRDYALAGLTEAEAGDDPFALFQIWFGQALDAKINEPNAMVRPKGLVPAPQIIDKKQPYHERRNAEIAFRDKGTRIPEHLKSGFPRSVGDLEVGFTQLAGSTISH